MEHYFTNRKGLSQAFFCTSLKRSGKPFRTSTSLKWGGIAWDRFCYMGVSKNRGTPKSSILIGISLINHPFWGSIIFGNTHMLSYPPKKNTQKTPFDDSLPIFFKVERNEECRGIIKWDPWNGGYQTMQMSGQIITTSAEVTLNGGLIMELPQNPLNSGLGIILICQEMYLAILRVCELFRTVSSRDPFWKGCWWPPYRG